MAANKVLMKVCVVLFGMVATYVILSEVHIERECHRFCNRDENQECFLRRTTVLVYDPDVEPHEMSFSQNTHPRITLANYATEVASGRYFSINCPVDHYWPRVSTLSRQKSCAIVGNSGILSDSNCGKVIDAHDFVMRANLAPIEGFTADVGERANLTILNFETLHFLHGNLTQKAINDHWHKAYVDRARYLNDSILWYSKSTVQKNSGANLKDVVYVLKSYYHLPVQMAYSWRPVSIGGLHGLRHYATTGFNTVIIAKTFCDNVTLYGFYPSRETENGYHVKHHYYEDMDYEYVNEVHNLKQEIQILQEMQKKGEISIVTDVCPGGTRKKVVSYANRGAMVDPKFAFQLDTKKLKEILNLGDDDGKDAAKDRGDGVTTDERKKDIDFDIKAHMYDRLQADNADDTMKYGLGDSQREQTLDRPRTDTESSPGTKERTDVKEDLQDLERPGANKNAEIKDRVMSNDRIAADTVNNEQKKDATIDIKAHMYDRLKAHNADDTMKYVLGESQRVQTLDKFKTDTDLSPNIGERANLKTDLKDHKRTGSQTNVEDLYSEDDEVKFAMKQKSEGVATDERKKDTDFDIKAHLYNRLTVDNADDTVNHVMGDSQREQKLERHGTDTDLSPNTGDRTDMKADLTGHDGPDVQMNAEVLPLQNVGRDATKVEDDATFEERKKDSAFDIKAHMYDRLNVDGADTVDRQIHTFDRLVTDKEMSPNTRESTNLKADLNDHGGPDAVVNVELNDDVMSIHRIPADTDASRYVLGDSQREQIFDKHGTDRELSPIMSKPDKRIEVKADLKDEDDRPDAKTRDDIIEGDVRTFLERIEIGGEAGEDPAQLSFTSSGHRNPEIALREDKNT